MSFIGASLWAWPKLVHLPVKNNKIAGRSDLEAVTSPVLGVYIYIYVWLSVQLVMF